VNRMIYALALVVAALAVVVAGCGGGSDSSSSGGAYSGKGGGGYGSGGENKSAKSESGSGGAVVSLGSVQKLGMVLVDSNGMTLYDFHKDKGTTPSCYGACAQAWPPLTTEGEPQVGNGASASKTGTTERKDGTTQVTYAGHPLYLFVEDQKPGEANGNDVTAFGGEWYALTASGAEPED
jgi:predicted lipoprotein with Yx(FWY)xxD motif